MEIKSDLVNWKMTKKPAAYQGHIQYFHKYVQGPFQAQKWGEGWPMKNMFVNTAQVMLISLSSRPCSTFPPSSLTLLQLCRPRYQTDPAGQPCSTWPAHCQPHSGLPIPSTNLRVPCSGSCYYPARKGLLNPLPTSSTSKCQLQPTVLSFTLFSYLTDFLTLMSYSKSTNLKP
jgi:hypothetical protein